MQDFYLIVNWVVAIALLCLGFVALLKNHSLTLNKVFALFTVTIGIWIVSSYISNDVKNSPHASVIGNYFVFLFSYISGYLLLWFAIALADDLKARRVLQKLALPIILTGLTTCTPLVVASAHRQGNVYALQFGPLVVLYFIGLLFALVWAMVILRKNIKRSHGTQKAHMLILYRSMGVALPILLLTEFILPALTGWFGLTNIGIVAMAIPVVGLYYSVVKLKLFNLRLIILRSVVYAVVLGIISVFYSVGSYYVTSRIAAQSDQTILGDVLNIGLIIAAVTIYVPLKDVFKRLTDRYFYHDAYDPQKLFDDLNKVLVSTIDLGKLLDRTAGVIETNLKAGSCSIVLQGTNLKQMRIGGDSVNFSEEDFHAIRLKHVAAKANEPVVVTDYLESDNQSLKKLLDENDIAVIARLGDASHAIAGRSLGYIILGSKKSGNAYTSQDAQVMATIANELVLAIQNALRFEEIEKFNETLQERVAEATRKLRKTNEKLRLLDQTKDDFIGMASHQLRTPLTSVKGYLSLVLDGDAGPIKPGQRKLLNQSFVSAQRMVYLIADLLNVSRLRTGKFVIEPTPVNLADLIQGEIEQLKEIAESKSQTLTFHKPEHFPTLNLDETKTRQVVMNFIDNALHYTPQGGHITVELENKPKTIEFRVIDDGIGVPKEEQHHLFTKFYRAKNAQKARPDGTGLGLFMAKKVVVGQGGATLFDSQEGKGSTFGFIFPKAALEHGQAQKVIEAA